MLVEVRVSPEEAVVTAGGRLTASVAPRLHRALLDAFAAGRAVRLVLRGVEEADLTLLQLVCAAQRTAQGRGVAFRLDGVHREPLVLALVRDAGAEAGAGCPGGCAWAGQAGQAGQADAAHGCSAG